MDSEERDEYSFIEKYPMDVLEAFISILIIRAIVDKPIDYFYVIKTSLVLGLLIYLIDLIGQDYKLKVREGLRSSIGNFIFKQFIN